MAVFSTNQNRQIYVALGFSEAAPTTKGYVSVDKDADGHVFIQQLGNGGLVRSDLIDPATVTYFKVTPAADMAIKLKKVHLALDTNVNGGKVIPGEDYVLNVNFRQAFGMSDENTYQKYGAVHATSAMVTTPALFWAELAYSLVKNFSKLYQPLVDIKVGGKVVARASKVGTTVKLYEASGAEIATTGLTGLDIVEASPVASWHLGTAPITRALFEVLPTTVYDGTSDLVWGVTTESTDGTVGNGYTMADMEYFYMGERADQYRMKGFPNVIKTDYFVDPAKTYATLDIHYAYQGTCEDIQKSEKDILVIAENIATLNSIVSAMGFNQPAATSLDGE